MPSKKNIVMDWERFEMLSSLFFELNGIFVNLKVSHGGCGRNYRPQI